MSSAILSAILFMTAAFTTLPQSRSALAQDKQSGRYTMHETDDGFLRLDTQTGKVMHCRKVQTWTCMPLESAKSVSRRQMARLQKENSMLRQYVKRLEDLLAKNGVDSQLAAPPELGSKAPLFRLPSEQEVEKALDYFENMLRKFQERLKDLERGQSKEPEAEPRRDKSL